METNAKIKPRIVEFVMFGIVCLVMPPELKSSVSIGKCVQKGDKYAKRKSNGKSEILLFFERTKRQQVTCRILCFSSFCLGGVKKPKRASQGSRREELAKKIKKTNLFGAYLAAPGKPNLSIWRGRGEQNQWARECGPEVTKGQNRRAAPASGGLNGGM